VRKSINRGMPGNCVFSGNGYKVEALIVDFSTAFDLAPNGLLLTTIANSGVDSRVVVWIMVCF
jgi:hypothetical protein